MLKCFASDCSHRNDKEMCIFFSIPAKFRRNLRNGKILAGNCLMLSVSNFVLITAFDHRLMLSRLGS